MRQLQLLFSLKILLLGLDVGPLELVNDKGLHFLNKTIEFITDKYLHRETTPYNPRVNDLTENGIMEKIMNKTVFAHKVDWDIKLPSTLWAYKIAEKITTKKTSSYLSNGLDSIIPVEFEIPTYRILELARLKEDLIY